MTEERSVGRYRIVRQVGRGGMAIVYLARQQDLNRDVALKELSSFHATSPDMAERFVRESRLAGSLNHPNIVTVLEYFEDDGVPFIAMEYVPRGSLRPYVGRLSPAQLAGVMEGVLAGLAHAEMHGIVHRDLKPENLMVTSDGRVKIADFGIAKATASAATGAFLTAKGTTVGTPAYMAPEQAMGQEVGPWTDLYSVGVMAWEQVVGHTPFHDTDAPMAILMRHVNEPIPPVVDVKPDADPQMSAWIERLLVKDAEQRTRSPTAAWEELEEIVISELGPRWRREARLPSYTEVLDTPKPLTPAPFESTRTPTPTPKPVARVEEAPAEVAPAEVAPAELRRVRSGTSRSGGRPRPLLRPRRPRRSRVRRLPRRPPLLTRPPRRRHPPLSRPPRLSRHPLLSRRRILPRRRCPSRLPPPRSRQSPPIRPMSRSELRLSLSRRSNRRPSPTPNPNRNRRPSPNSKPNPSQSPNPNPSLSRSQNPNSKRNPSRRQNPSRARARARTGARA